MINLKQIKELEVQENLAKRGYQIPNELFDLLEKQKTTRIAMETIQAKMNKGEHTALDKEALKLHKDKLDMLEKKINAITYLIPNLIHETVPMGKGEEDNVQLEVFFEQEKKQTQLDHVKIGEKFGLDTETGVELAHARFTVMKGEVAKLHRKLTNLALDFYTTLGYEEHYVPNLVNQQTIQGTGQYPKFKEELFTTEGERPLFLIPTGEVPLTNTVQNKMLKEEEATQNLMTHTPCFRREAGAYGKDTKGIIRQHQFEKVELVKVCLPEEGLTAFNQMIEDVKAFVMQFGIPFRIIELCAGDIGFAGHKAYDFEIWFPTQQKFREIATVTWCTDFQARRMNTRVKRKDGKKELVHTLNGTGLAVGRVLAAILENCYDGKNLILPACLK
jgi:seryl-tRNA synthetase